MDHSWGMDLIRNISGSLDRTVYWLVGYVYQLLYDIAGVDILNQETISQFYTKIYVLLGLFMIFKISFSVIKYIVDPDALLDKNKGAQKILVNTMISITLLTLAPFGFSMLSRTQTALLSDQVIERFFLGKSTDDLTSTNLCMSDKCDCDASGNTVEAKNPGHFLAISAFRAFYQPYEDANMDDIDDYCKATNATVKDVVSNSEYLSLHGALGSRKYNMEYNIFISTIVGVVLCLLIVSFCFDIAVRALKLGFLELIAPIPIVSYIDPEKSKNGMFSKWLKEVGKTWADLFIRLAAISMAVFIIEMLVNNEISGMDVREGIDRIWLELFIIFGALIFAKKLPSLIEGLTGLKLSGSIQLNPLKKIENEALFGKQIAGATRAIGGAAGAAALGLGFSAVRSGTALAHGLKLGYKQDAALAARNGLQNRLAQSNRNIDNMKVAGQQLLSRSKNAQSVEEKAVIEQERKQLLQSMADEVKKRNQLEIDIGAADKNYSDAKKAYDKFANTKFARKPMSGVIGEASASALAAMKQGYKNPKAVLKNAISGSEAGIQHRRFYENYTVGDKARDMFTSFAGITNASGTSSELSGELKELKEAGAKLEKASVALQQSLSHYSPTAYNYDASGNVVFNERYSGADANDIKALITSIHQVNKDIKDNTTSQNRVTKAIEAGKKSGDKK